MLINIYYKYRFMNFIYGLLVPELFEVGYLFEIQAFQHMF